MDRSEIITLVGRSREKDAKGVYREVCEPTLREVFCQVDSVTRQEFFAGGEHGLHEEDWILVTAEQREADIVFD